MKGEVGMTREEFYSDFKLIMVYINEAQKSRLEDFFEEIRFYYYAVQRKLETVWSDKIKHKNSTVWPGTDCIFMLSVPSCDVDKMLKYLKTFRMSLPEGIVMSVGIVPMDRVIPRMYEEDIPVDEELLEKLKNKYTK